MQAANAAAHTVLNDHFATLADVPVVQAMRYALQGGKGFRAFLVIESARLYGLSGIGAARAAAAVEAMHAYSLVHDDLPAIDDDDLRRGQPTVHKKWDDPTAILAGDALQTLAFELLTIQGGPVVKRANLYKLIAALAKASGADGMVLGQAQDIAAETAATPLGIDDIIALQRNKTGALIRWSAIAGPLMMSKDTSIMRHYARALGLAFQIADDILDVEGSAADVGKATGKDADAGKATFVSLLGLAGAKARARDLVAEACDVLAPFGDQAQILKDAAHFVVERKK
ncbi:MAG: polyprenyl synthetase family protein [Pseudomonadota bacterium]